MDRDSSRERILYSGHGSKRRWLCTVDRYEYPALSSVESNRQKLILNGESNSQTIHFSDTMNIVRCNKDTLVVERRKRNIVFVKNSNHSETVKNEPTRKAYDGFVWKKISGAGLTLWVQENENIRLIADPSLPGISMVRKGDKAPHMLIQVFHLSNKDINDVIRTLENRRTGINDRHVNLKK